MALYTMNKVLRKPDFFDAVIKSVTHKTPLLTILKLLLSKVVLYLFHSFVWMLAYIIGTLKRYVLSIYLTIEVFLNM